MLKTIQELLDQQKIVEAMVRAQPSRGQELVESVVHKQHLAELQTALARAPVGEIARILETLTLDDAVRLWPQIAPDRLNDILWELPLDRATALAGPAEPRFECGKVTTYQVVDGRMLIVDVATRGELEQLRPLWIDVLGASRAEREWISRHYGVELPDPDALTDLETSARYYVEESDEVHLHSNFLLDREGQSRSVPVAFVIHAETLFTVRGEELPVFRLQRLRMRNQPGEVADCKDLLLALYAADVEYSADALEDTYATLRRIGRQVLNEEITDSDAAGILGDIAEEEDVNGRIRGNMLDTQRAVSFLVRGRFLTANQLEDAREIVRDIESLNSHTAFLFDKINFLMDATVGFINVSQNKRVTQLTITSVVFMPINVLAGVGGMSEFSMMTQGIPWPVAYATFMVAMMLVGWGTYQALKYYERRQSQQKLSAASAAMGATRG